MKPTIYAFLGQKGGGGKSAGAVSLATWFYQRKRRVLLADTDSARQQTATRWFERRQDRIKTDYSGLVVRPFASVDLVQQAIGGFDVVIVDGLPFAGSAVLRLSKLSDRIILPSSTGLDDLGPTCELAGQLVDEGIDAGRILIAINRSLSESQGEQALKVVDYYGHKASAVLRASPVYIEALEKGKALHEASAPSLRAEGQKYVKSLAI